MTNDEWQMTNDGGRMTNMRKAELLKRFHQKPWLRICGAKRNRDRGHGSANCPA